MDTTTKEFRRRVPRPVFRKLRVFAIDPGMTARFETAVLNQMTLAIPWEPLEPGPVGEYLAVVDVNDAGSVYTAVWGIPIEKFRARVRACEKANCLVVFEARLTCPWALDAAR